MPGVDTGTNAGDRNYLVLAKPNVIMNDIRLRGLNVAGTDAAGRKSPHNHAQTARNLRRSLRNAASGARLIQADGLNSKSAAEVSVSLAEALEELDRLQRILDRRIRRDRICREGLSSWLARLGSTIRLVQLRQRALGQRRIASRFDLLRPSPSDAHHWRG